MRGQFWALAMGAALLLHGGLARAECTKDTDCKGERICSEGKCVDPAPASAPPAAASASAPPTAEGATPATGAGAPASEPKSSEAATKADADLDSQAHQKEGRRGARVLAAERQPDDDRRFFDEEEKKPQRVRKRFKNPGLLAAGIVVAGSAPVVLMVGALSFKCDQYSCHNNYTGYGVAALCLIGAGVPMIVIGSRREPVGQALLVPWAGAKSAGVALDLRL